MALPVDRSDLVRAVDERATGPDPLDRLVAGLAVQADLVALGADVVQGLVADARAAGCSWARIGHALGVTKQAAQQRFRVRLDAAARAAGGPGVVEAVVEAAAEAARTAGRRAVEPADLLVALLPGSDGPSSVGAAAAAGLGLHPDGASPQGPARGARRVGDRVARSEATATVVARAAELGASRGAAGGDTGDLLEAVAEVLGPDAGVPVERVRAEVARLRRYGFADGTGNGPRRGG